GTAYRRGVISRVRHGAIAAAALGLAAVLLAAAPVTAGKPPPVTITVTSTSDDVSPADGGCSLRAAINGSDGSTHAATGNCGHGTFGYDSVVFSLGSGTPVINVAGDLPSLTNGVAINGATGGAKRVRIHGPGSGMGLDLEGAFNSHVYGVVIDGFDTGMLI